MSGLDDARREESVAAIHALEGREADPSVEQYADALSPLLARWLDEARAEGAAEVVALFAGGPDTECRTTWREEPGLFGETYLVECVEVPMDRLRAAITPPTGDDWQGDAPDWTGGSRG